MVGTAYARSRGGGDSHRGDENSPTAPVRQGEFGTSQTSHSKSATPSPRSFLQARIPLKSPPKLLRYRLLSIFEVKATTVLRVWYEIPPSFGHQIKGSPSSLELRSYRCIR